MTANLIKSKSKRLKKISLPVYKEDKKLSRYPINLQGGIVLPEEFEEYIPVVRQMLKECPIKSGTGLLMIQSENTPHQGNYGATQHAMMIVANDPRCKGWNGNFQGVIGVNGTIKPHTSKLRAKSAKSFDMKPNTLYLCNAGFVYEALYSEKKVNQVAVSILLPSDVNIN